MKLYVITYTSMISGTQRRAVYKKAFRTKEAAKDVMNSAYKQWMSAAEKYNNLSGCITKQSSGDDYFFIYNTLRPERFEVDYSIDEVELPDEDN